jgi:hypothetical protein
MRPRSIDLRNKVFPCVEWGFGNRFYWRSCNAVTNGNGGRTSRSSFNVASHIRTAQEDVEPRRIDGDDAATPSRTCGRQRGSTSGDTCCLSKRIIKLSTVDNMKWHGSSTIVMAMSCYSVASASGFKQHGHLLGGIAVCTPQWHKWLLNRLFLVLDGYIILKDL